MSSLCKIPAGHVLLTTRRKLRRRLVLRLHAVVCQCSSSVIAIAECDQEELVSSSMVFGHCETELLLLLCSTQPNSQMASTKGEEGGGGGGGGDGERWVKKGRGLKVQ